MSNSVAVTRKTNTNYLWLKVSNKKAYVKLHITRNSVSIITNNKAESYKRIGTLMTAMFHSMTGTNESRLQRLEKELKEMYNLA